jgi:hypothetical protein
MTEVYTQYAAMGFFCPYEWRIAHAGCINLWNGYTFASAHTHEQQRGKSKSFVQEPVK